MASGFDILGPIGYAWVVTPTDTATKFAKETRCIFLGTAGDVCCDMVSPSTNNIVQVTFTGLAAGVPHPIKTLRILATGTTATNITAGA